MRNLITATLVVVVLVFIVKLHSQTVAIQALQAAAAKAAAAPPAAGLPPAPSLELQGQCAKQAAVVFRQEGYGTEKLADFTNHYNAKMGRCFVVITNTKADSKSIMTSKNLSDAFEGKVYGSYEWINVLSHLEIHRFQYRAGS